jgi:hypothetical protein
MRLSLGAHHGLRHGLNRLRVVAANRRTGAYEVARRRIVVGRAHPVAGAAGKRLAGAGARIRLDAGASRPANGGELSYRWEVVRAPRGARPRIAGGDRRRAVLVPDLPGVYETRVTVAERRRASRRAGSAVVAADADVLHTAVQLPIPPMGARLETQAPTQSPGAPYATVINGTEYPATATSGTATQVLVLDRATLGDPNSRTFDLNDAAGVKAFKDYLRGLDEDQLVIASAPAQCCSQLPSLNDNVGYINSGFTSIFVGGHEDKPMASNTLLIGKPGEPQKRPWGAMYGWLRPASEGHTAVETQPTHAFVAGDYEVFKTAADGPPSGGRNTIEVGGTRYAAELLAGALGGFQVLILDQQLDEVINSVYATNTGDPGRDAQGAKDMAGLLGFLAGGRSNFFIVQSIGRPKPSPATGVSWSAIGDAINKLGGTKTVFNKLDGSGDYALVGGAGAQRAAEASAPLTQGMASSRAKAYTGQLTGVLTRGSNSLWQALLFDSLPPDESRDPPYPERYSLLTIAEQDPVPWPPNVNPAAEQKAVAWISRQLNDGRGLGDPGQYPGTAWCYRPTDWDVRAEYCNEALKTSWASTYHDQLKALTFEAGHGFDEPTFGQVGAQLATEFQMIPAVNDLRDDLQKPFGSTQVNAAIDFVTTSRQVKDALALPDAASVGGQADEILNSLLDLGIHFLPEGAAITQAVDVVTSAVSYAEETSQLDDGSSVLDEFDTNAAAIGGELATRFKTTSQRIDRLRALMVSDWAKLSAVSQNAPNAWSQGADDFAAQASKLELESKQWLWARLTPAAYDLVRLPPPPPWASLQNNFTCLYGAYPYYSDDWPFKSATDSGYVVARTSDGSGNMVNDSLYALGSAVGKQQFRVPPASLTDQLFKSPSTGGVGLVKEWFYLRSFGGPTHDITEYEGTTRLKGGNHCNWTQKTGATAAGARPDGRGRTG